MSVLAPRLQCVRPRCFLAVILSAIAIPVELSAQSTPPAPGRVWQVPSEEKTRHALLKVPEPRVTIDPNHTYALAELVDLAESHSPETQAAWENAKIQAAELGIARSALYPSLAAAALALTTRQGILFGSAFVRQTVGLYQAQFEVNYLLFDFGSRASRIELSRTNLLGANFGFNETHLRVIYQTIAAFYRLLNAEGQEVAARASLTNSQTVQQAVEDRLAHGLATLPDALEARSSTAQSEYDLQNAIGAEEIARGDLLTTITAEPSSPLKVQPIDTLAVPDALSEPLEQVLNRALEQRPDLLSRVAQLRGAEAEIRGARAAFFPSFSFRGQAGEVRAYGQQDVLPSTYLGPVEEWNAQLSLNWTLFDGGQRRNALARAHSDRRRAEDDLNLLRDEIADQVWTSYSDSRTALRRRQAAAALLTASNESYNASLEAYRYGVRSLLDVVAAQRTLAQARAADVSARTQVLAQFATLAFRTGDLLHTRAPSTPRKP
ncbi:MAG: outer rane efflux protein [Bryobacterales bacterium]|nr:outer rane efflux protein [Bryobacterales bacterium]